MSEVSQTISELRADLALRSARLQETIAQLRAALAERERMIRLLPRLSFYAKHGEETP